MITHLHTGLEPEMTPAIPRDATALPRSRKNQGKTFFQAQEKIKKAGILRQVFSRNPEFYLDIKSLKIHGVMFFGWP